MVDNYYRQTALKILEYFVTLVLLPSEWDWSNSQYTQHHRIDHSFLPLVAWDITNSYERRQQDVKTYRHIFDYITANWQHSRVSSSDSLSSIQINVSSQVTNSSLYLPTLIFGLIQRPTEGEASQKLISALHGQGTIRSKSSHTPEDMTVLRYTSRMLLSKNSFFISFLPTSERFQNWDMVTN